MAHSAYFDHIKTQRLRALLAEPIRPGGDPVPLLLPHAVGYWECFLHYVSQNYADGNITGMDCEAIELVAGWPGKPRAYAEALIRVRSIDCRHADMSLILVTRDPDAPVPDPAESDLCEVHDWLKWCPDFIRKKVWRRLDGMVKAGIAAEMTPYQRQAAQTVRVKGLPSDVLRGTSLAPGCERPTTAAIGSHRPPVADTGSHRQPSADSGGRSLPKRSGEGRSGEGRSGEGRSGEGRSRRGPSPIGRELQSAASGCPNSSDSDSEGRNGCEIPADSADGGTDGGSHRRTSADDVARAVRHFEAKTGVAYDRAERLPMAARIPQFLKAAGIDDSGFRTAVSRRLGAHKELWPKFLSVYVRFVARHDRIDNPGGWFRTALKAEGIDI